MPHDKLLAPVTGGVTRQDSCKAGVDAIAVLGFDKVLIHDAARPFVPHETTSNILNGIEKGVCALPASAIADTVKRADENGIVEETVSRENLYLAQTPQGFIANEIHAAHTKADNKNLHEFTDDAAVAECAGMQVKLVDGFAGNFLSLIHI